MESTPTAQNPALNTDVQIQPACQHHWVIDRPAGPTSRGVCRVCGEEKQFQNYIESSSWGYDVSLEHLSGGSRISTRSQTPRVSDDADLEG